MPTETINGIDIHFRHEGTGPRLLFLNGSGSTLAASALMIDQFAPGFELLALDHRGTGGTSIPGHPWTMADCAADTLALMDHVGWPTARVVGVSFGGMVAQEVAVTAPERIERLALLCTSPGGPGGSSYPLHELAASPPEEQSATRVRILDTRFTPEWLAEHPRDQMIADASARRGDEDPSAAVARGLALQLEARRRHDVYDRLDRITAPTFVGSGRFDGIAPPANGEAIAARVPGAELHLYDGGHAFFFQDRAALPQVIEFLRS